MENQKDDFDLLSLELEKELMNRQRDDSGDANAVSTSNQARIGVLMRLLTAVQDEKEYRQALITADFLDDEEADRVSSAVTEANRYGLPLAPIMDHIASRCAVNKAGHGKSRVVLSIEGLTHSTFNQNRNDRGKRGIFSNNDKEKQES